jgi:RimJ/RimL family protein N-acetyltransferase
MKTYPDTDLIDTKNLLMEFFQVPWDTEIFGFSVAQISRIELREPGACGDFAAFEHRRESIGVRLVSCRLPHNRLTESMFLEDRGFRFVEMTYSPELENLKQLDWPSESMEIARADPADLSEIEKIASQAFQNERFHVDPRLNSELGNKRYQVWVKNAASHATQRLYRISDSGELVAFFVTEHLPDGTCYWHLNAVAPTHQGRGYGIRAWRAMILHAQEQGAERVRTTIVARNFRVLNLYARLGFRFPPPMMTFHWVAN